MHGCSFERGLDIGQQHIQHQNINTGHIFPHKGPQVVKCNISKTNLPSICFFEHIIYSKWCMTTQQLHHGLKVNPETNSVAILKLPLWGAF